MKTINTRPLKGEGSDNSIARAVAVAKARRSTPDADYPRRFAAAFLEVDPDDIEHLELAVQHQDGNGQVLAYPHQYHIRLRRPAPLRPRQGASVWVLEPVADPADDPDLAADATLAVFFATRAELEAAAVAPRHETELPHIARRLRAIEDFIGWRIDQIRPAASAKPSPEQIEAYQWRVRQCLHMRTVWDARGQIPLDGDDQAHFARIYKAKVGNNPYFTGDTPGGFLKNLDTARDWLARHGQPVPTHWDPDHETAAA